jgi:hypothetical protein
MITHGNGIFGAGLNPALSILINVRALGHNGEAILSGNAGKLLKK